MSARAPSRFRTTSPPCRQSPWWDGDTRPPEDKPGDQGGQEEGCGRSQASSACRRAFVSAGRPLLLCEERFPHFRHHGKVRIDHVRDLVFEGLTHERRCAALGKAIADLASLPVCPAGVDGLGHDSIPRLDLQHRWMREREGVEEPVRHERMRFRRAKLRRYQRQKCEWRKMPTHVVHKADLPNRGIGRLTV